jgi:hypothetical protein
MWPKFRLTNTEARFNTKYYDPRVKGTPALRRMYGGKLELGPNKQRDLFTFQISRRSRVMGFTVSGDISQFLLTFSDVSGEQFTADPVPVAGLVCGYNMLPLSARYNSVGAGQQNLAGVTLTPYIFEPNIILAPNNTLQVTATPTGPVIPLTTFRIDFTLHVYEFPGMPGSPI